MILLQLVPIGSRTLGVVIPAVIFIVSFLVAWLLFRHFTKKGH